VADGLTVVRLSLDEMGNPRHAWRNRPLGLHI
jgi:hypothetical protein